MLNSLLGKMLLLGGQGASAASGTLTTAPQLTASASPVVPGTTFTYVPGEWTDVVGAGTARLVDETGALIHAFVFGAGDTYVAVSGDAGKKGVHVEETLGETGVSTTSYDIAPRAASSLTVDAQGDGGLATSILPVFAWTTSPDTDTHRLEVSRNSGFTDLVALLNSTVAAVEYTTQMTDGYLPIRQGGLYYARVIPVVNGVEGAASSTVSFSLNVQSVGTLKAFFDSVDSVNAVNSDGTGGAVADAGTVGWWGGLDATPDNATQATEGSRPVYTASDSLFAGQPSFNFASNKFMSADISYTYDEDYTMYFVVSHGDWSAPRYIVGNSTNGGTAVVIGSSGTTITVRAITTAGYSVTFTDDALPTDESFVIEVKRTHVGTTGTGTCYVNGVQFGTPQNMTLEASPNNTAMAINQIGRRSTASYWLGKMASLGFYTGAHSDAQRAAVRQYLMQRVGVAYTGTDWYVSADAELTGNGAEATPATFAKFIAQLAPLTTAGNTIHMTGTDAHTPGSASALSLTGSSGSKILIDGKRPGAAIGAVANVDLGAPNFSLNGDYISLRNLRVWSSSDQRIVAEYAENLRASLYIVAPNIDMVNVHMDSISPSAFNTCFAFSMKGCLVTIPLVDAPDRAHQHAMYYHWDAEGDPTKWGLMEKSIYISANKGCLALRFMSSGGAPAAGITYRDIVAAHGRAIFGGTDDATDIVLENVIRWGGLEAGYANADQIECSVTGSWFGNGNVQIARSWVTAEISNNVIIPANNGDAYTITDAGVWDYVTALSTGGGALDYDILITSKADPFNLGGIGYKTLAQMQALGLCLNTVQYASLAAAITAGAIPAGAKTWKHVVDEDDHYCNLIAHNYSGGQFVTFDLSELTGTFEFRQCRDYLVDRVQFTIGTPSDSNGVSMDSSGNLTIDMRPDTAGGYRTTEVPLAWVPGSAYHPTAVPANALPEFLMGEVWSA